MITVYMMTEKGPGGIRVNASSVKVNERGALQCYGNTDKLVATFAIWAYWMDDSAQLSLVTGASA